MPAALGQIAFWVAASVLGVSGVLQLDALTIATRGGGSDAIQLAHVMATAVGVAGGLVLWAAGRALWELGSVLARASQRVGGPAVSPLFPIVVAGTLATTYALAPAHRVFSQHPATMVLLMLYLPFPLAALFTGGALLIRNRRFRAPSVLLCALGVGALHFANVWYYPGLYPPVHHALTGGALAIAVTGAAIALAGIATRLLARGLAIAIGLALLSPLFGAPATALRTRAFFDGTELHHTLAAIETAVDADGDGYRPGFGGDCDDTRRDVNPLRMERPGNGIDDNCRLGDLRSRKVAESTRAAPPPPGLAAWQAQHRHPNVVIVLIDTLRADFVGALGSRRGLTPALDAFATTASVFEQARTTSPRTTPALIALAGGRFHGRNMVCRGGLTPAPMSLPVQLEHEGYSVVARIVGSNWTDNPAVVGWTKVIQKGSIHTHTSAAVTDDGLALVAQARQPFLLLLHYADPHSPYRAPQAVPRRGSGVAAEYGAEVESTDHEVGRFLNGLRAAGRLQDTVVVAFSDHGENLGERGSRGGHHGVSLYDEDVHVPLMIHVPGVAPQRIGAPVSIVDIAPTLLELAGAQPLAGSDGRSLAGYLLGSAPPPTWTLSEYYEPPHFLRAMVADHFKLIHDVGNNAFRLFDLRADPRELVDVAPTQRERVASLVAELDRWIETRADPGEPLPELCAR